jgi:hypothetical protein
MAHPTNETKTVSVSIINIFFIEHTPLSLVKQLLYHCLRCNNENNYIYLTGDTLKLGGKTGGKCRIVRERIDNIVRREA